MALQQQWEQAVVDLCYHLSHLYNMVRDVDYQDLFYIGDRKNSWHGKMADLRIALRQIEDSGVLQHAPLELIQEAHDTIAPPSDAHDN